ncbi:MAG: hypothetical protein Q7O66_20165, partial [Dehalococcoidia bacterium]|nr:hypothetical protein [Dehalococcoidia bacterium]
MDQWLTDQEYWLSPKNKRLKELKSQYPKLPMAVIIQNDVMCSGVKPTPFVWEIAAKYGGSPGVAFQNRDHHKFFMTAEHKIKPRSFQLPDDTYCLFIFGPDAPYEVKPDGPGGEDGIWLYRDDEPLVKISFAESSKGHLCGIEGGYSLRHCSLFNTGEQCHFCSITPEQQHRQAIGYEKAQSPYTPVAEMQA